MLPLAQQATDIHESQKLLRSSCSKRRHCDSAVTGAQNLAGISTPSC
jgi:hypothetical protein